MARATHIAYHSFSPHSYFSRFQFLLDHYQPGFILDLGNIGGLHGHGTSYSSHLAFRNRLSSTDRLIGLDLFLPANPKDYPHQLQANLNHQLPFKDDLFNTVYMGEILEHLPNPGFTLSQIHRVLKPKGHLIIDVPNPYSLVNLTHYIIKRQEDLGDPTHITLMTPASLIAQITAAGLKLNTLSTKLYPSLKLLPTCLTQGLGSHLLICATNT